MPAPQKLPSTPEIQRLSAEGVTYAEIAARYGVTVHAVHARMGRAGLKTALPRPTPGERFWAKVDRGAGPNACWRWTASLDSHGYGQFMARGRVPTKSHRFAYEDLVGPIPAGMEIDHLCRRRHCVRPTHLQAVTPRTNNLRSTSPAAIHARQTHCVNGHEFTVANTYAYRTVRMCRTCQRARKNTAAYRAKENARRRTRYAARKS